MNALIDAKCPARCANTGTGLVGTAYPIRKEQHQMQTVQDGERPRLTLVHDTTRTYQEFTPEESATLAESLAAGLADETDPLMVEVRGVYLQFAETLRAEVA